MRKPIKKIKNPSDRAKLRRKLSVRRKINGTSDRPRVCAVKTNKHISVQIVDDVAGKTLLSVATFGKNKVGTTSNVESAKLVGAKVAELMKGKGIASAVFDRNGSNYHGVIAAVAEGIRENGIQL